MTEPAAPTTCDFIPETAYVLAGWGCCRCRTYNGVWREQCKDCGHARCVDIVSEVIERQQAIRKELGYD